MIEELIIRTLCDTLPRKADAVFLFGQTADNQQAVFEVAQQLLEKNQVKKILFLRTEAMSGYPGFESWKNALTQMGVPQEALEAIPPVPADTDMLHTRIEAVSMVQHARRQEYTRIIAIAAPFQQPRAFMAAVTAANEFYPALRLYSLPGKPLPWHEEVKHSQGEVQDTRAGLIAGEMERIRTYNQKGDLATVEEVLGYLNTRDASH